MSGSRTEFRYAGQLISALAMCVTLICGLVPAAAADTHSSPEDRARFVSITRNLEGTPLKPSLKADRAWAVEWLTEVPDISVTVCDDPLGGVVQSDYAYAPEILVQYMFSMAAHIIEHPEITNDPNAQQLAGVEGALTAYRSILRQKPDAKSPALERVLQAQTRRELPDFVQKAFISCKSKEQNE